VEVTVPGPYQPPQHRAPQAQTEKRLTRRQVVWLSPLVALLPIAVVLAANLVGDALRDALDVRLRRR